MIYNVHLLRVVAALAVVYYHIASEAGLALRLPFGRFGVDIFFVVSGFIIAYIGSKSPNAFLTRRIIRVVPFYWSASIFVFGIACMFPDRLRQTKADPLQLAYSLFFIPYRSATGDLYPTLILGWTLNYEIYFYVLFACALACSRRFAPFICSGLLIVIAVAIYFSETQNEAVLFYSRPIVAEFVFGILIYYAVNWIERRAVRHQNLVWLRVPILGLTFVTFIVLVTQELNGGFGWPRAIASGLPASFLVLGAILLEKLYSIRSDNKGVFLLGEASYILYLIHPYVIYGVLRLIVGSTAALGPAWIGLLIASLLTLTSVAALVIHVWFERPLIRYLRRVMIKPEDSGPRRMVGPQRLEGVNTR